MIVAFSPGHSPLAQGSPAPPGWHSPELRRVAKATGSGKCVIDRLVADAALRFGLSRARDRIFDGLFAGRRALWFYSSCNASRPVRAPRETASLGGERMTSRHCRAPTRIPLISERLTAVDDMFLFDCCISCRSVRAPSAAKVAAQNPRGLSCRLLFPSQGSE